MNSLGRRLAAAGAVLAVAAAGSGCSGSSLGPPAPTAELTIGLMLPQTGPYTAIGDDMRRGFDLYLRQHGGRLGGHPVRIVYADEADGGTAARAAADKLIKQDRVVAVVGTATAPAASTAAAAATPAKIPFLGVGGRPSTLADLGYVWHTSFLSTDHGQAIAGHVRSTVDGPVYVIGPDYQGGRDQIGGFVQAFTAAGGRLANPGGQPAYTPWPGTDNFGPWLSKVADTGAQAVYTFYAGAPAVAFVNQYRQFGLHGRVPLYAAGFLTEGAVLAAQGAAADGIYTVANYAAGLDNPTNQAFAAALQAGGPVTPTIYHVTAFDAAAVLDRAIGAAGPNPTGTTINTAIGDVGAVDSPRGSWHFNPTSHTPVQPWYLRQVAADGPRRANTVIQPLGVR